jgi:hypothetical protein
MRNKVLVVLILLLCLWVTLEKSVNKRPKRVVEEDDSED